MPVYPIRQHNELLVHITLNTKNVTYMLILFFREKMAQAYDFALDKIGMEIMSYQVRSDAC